MRKIVTTAEEWTNVKAYGTFEIESGNFELWSWGDDQYILDTTNLSLCELTILMECYGEEI